MKKARRITKFTVEIERLFIFRAAAKWEFNWCSGCAAETQMATVACAAREAGLSESDIHQLLEARVLHFSQDAEGHVLVCLNSLLK